MIPFTNQATLSYNNRVTNSNITTGQIASVLSGSKSSLSDSYTAGNNITYVVSIVNSGSTSFENLTVNDNLGAYTTAEGTTVYPLAYIDGSLKYYINGVLQADPATVSGPPLAVSGISVPAGGNALIVYESAVTDFAPLAEDGTIANVATVNGAGLTAPLSLANTLESSTDPLLTITKSLSPAVVPENGELTYTFVIQNFGNTAATADDNAVVTDLFNPALSNLTVTFDGAPWAEGTNYTYNEATGAFATVAGQIVVPAATYSQNPDTGSYITEPGVATLTVRGTI